MSDKKWPIGVFASLDTGLGIPLSVAIELGLPTVQLHAPSRGARTPDAATELVELFDKNNLELTCIFAGFEGESYADIPTVEQTIGLVPEQTRTARIKEVNEISDFGCLLGCAAIGMHIGVIPAEKSGPAYKDLITAARQVCDHAQSNVQSIHLETGQETAKDLLQFISDVDRENLFINFDPANLILYGMGEPIEDLKAVGKFVRSVHCKDAIASDQPGVKWGQEVRLGDGQVNIADFLEALESIGYDGALTIEREIPQDPAQQKADVSHAVQLLTSIRDKM